MNLEGNYGEVAVMNDGWPVSSVLDEYSDIGSGE